MDARLRSEVNILEQQNGFMQRKKSTDARFALRMFLKNKEGQKEVHVIFVDLEEV